MTLCDNKVKMAITDLRKLGMNTVKADNPTFNDATAEYIKTLERYYVANEADIHRFQECYKAEKEQATHEKKLAELFRSFGECSISDKAFFDGLKELGVKWL